MNQLIFTFTYLLLGTGSHLFNYFWCLTPSQNLVQALKISFSYFLTPRKGFKLAFGGLGSDSPHEGAIYPTHPRPKGTN